MVRKEPSAVIGGINRHRNNFSTCRLDVKSIIVVRADKRVHDVNRNGKSRFFVWDDTFVALPI
jgi:hypothetical protein